MWTRARLIAAAAVLTWSAAVFADDPYARGFDPDPSKPALSFGANFAVESAEITPAKSWRAELLLDYTHGLLALKLGDEKLGNIIENRLALHAMGSYSFGRLEIGVDVPVAAWQGTNLGLITDPPPDGAGMTGPLADDISSFAMGDVRLFGRYTLFTQSQAPVALALALDLHAPTGNKQAFTSDGFIGKPGVVISRRFGRLRLDGELGYIFRKQGQYAQLVVHDAFAYGVGLAYNLPKTSAFKNWRLIADASGQFPRGYSFNTDRYRAPLSVRGGLRAQVWKSLGFEVGVGSGFSFGQAGYGREAYRVFAGIRWDHAYSDRDGDGVEDDSDRCPDVPGIARLDGCPEGDRDGDGVPDSEDKCPDIPGPKELKGCPAGDQDGDGVPDKEDRCPTVPGPKDMEGCPDSDGDGVPDIDDKCPKEPGPVPNDGCPLGDEPVVEIETERLSLRDAIQFDTDKDTLRPDSFKVLNEIVKILGAHLELKKIRIEGHTDNVGSASYNLDLSKRRARTVVLYLGSHGISPARLTSEGYGFTRPVASNTTAFGRAKNRRVEFVIVGGDTSKTTEKPAATPAKPPADAAKK